MDPIVWIVLGVLVLLVIIGVFVSRSRAQREASQRAEAEQLRASAAEHDRDLREREAEAAAADAQARRARAEADERAAEAERLAVEAERRDEHRVEAQRVRDEELRRADALDPDVKTDKHGYRLDDDEELADPYGGRGETRHSDPREEHPDRHNTRIVGTPVGSDPHPNGDRPDHELRGGPHGEPIVRQRSDREGHEGVDSPLRREGAHDGPHESSHDERAHDERDHHGHTHDGLAHGERTHGEHTHEGAVRDGSRDGDDLDRGGHAAVDDEHHASAADRAHGVRDAGFSGEAAGGHDDAAGRHEASTDGQAGGRRMDGSVLDKSHLDAPRDDRGLDGTADGAHGPADAATPAQHGQLDDSDYPSAADRDHRRRTDGPDAER